MQRLRYGQLILVLFVSVLGSATLLAAPKDTTAVADGAKTDIPSDADLASQQCAGEEERFLPGDYYFCLGTQTYGKGHYEKARKFYTTAASWASKPAQYVLGIMALHGDHQPVNRPQALAWLAMAAERHRVDFEAAYTSNYAAATPAEQRAADALLQKMRPTYADATAAVRAEQRYRKSMASLANHDEGTICIATDMMRNQVHCIGMASLAQVVDKSAANVFDGWRGHVSVGEIQPAGPASAAPRKSQ